MKRFILVLAPAFADAKPANLGHCHKALNSGLISVNDFNNSEFNQAFNPETAQGKEAPFGSIACRIG